MVYITWQHMMATEHSQLNLIGKTGVSQIFKCNSITT